MPILTRATPSSSVRPALKAALRPLWRDHATLQLGIDSRRAIVITGLGPADRALVERLDGCHDLDELCADDADHGARPERVRELIAVLDHAGALEVDTVAIGSLGSTNPHAPDLLTLSLLDQRAPKAVLDERAATEVEVYGAGRVGATLAGLLAAAGIGRIRLNDEGALRHVDLAPGGVRSRELAPGTRGAAARRVVEAVRRPRRERAAEPGRSAVVLAPTGPVIPPEWLRRVRHRPHLAVVVRDTAAVIGPLVLPGRSACLRCLELARADRDPAWPALAAQLVSRTRQVDPCEITLAATAAGIAAMHLVRWLDQPESAVALLGGTLELSLDDLQLRRRSLRGHPTCGCGADQPDVLPLGER